MSKCRLKVVPYPDYLSWVRRAKVIKLGTEIVNKTGEVFIVKERLVSSTYGAEPRLSITPQTETEISTNGTADTW